MINRKNIIQLSSLKNQMVESLNEELVNKFESELELEEEKSITKKIAFLQENALFFK
jgi:hypothetical protein